MGVMVGDTTSGDYGLGFSGFPWNDSLPLRYDSTAAMNASIAAVWYAYWKPSCIAGAIAVGKKATSSILAITSGLSDMPAC